MADAVAELGVDLSAVEAALLKEMPHLGDQGAKALARSLARGFRDAEKNAKNAAKASAKAWDQGLKGIKDTAANVFGGVVRDLGDIADTAGVVGTATARAAVGFVAFGAALSASAGAAVQLARSGADAEARLYALGLTASTELTDGMRAADVATDQLTLALAELGVADWIPTVVGGVVALRDLAREAEGAYESTALLRRGLLAAGTLMQSEIIPVVTQLAGVTYPDLDAAGQDLIDTLREQAEWEKRVSETWEDYGPALPETPPRIRETTAAIDATTIALLAQAAAARRAGDAIRDELAAEQEALDARTQGEVAWARERADLQAAEEQDRRDYLATWGSEMAAAGDASERTWRDVEGSITSVGGAAQTLAQDLGTILTELGLINDEASKTAGILGGVATGALGGAAAGSALGPVGAVLGGILGGVAGGISSRAWGGPVAPDHTAYVRSDESLHVSSPRGSRALEAADRGEGGGSGREVIVVAINQRPTTRRIDQAARGLGGRVPLGMGRRWGST